MTGNIVYRVIWSLYILHTFDPTNAAPTKKDNLLNKQGVPSKMQKDCQVSKKYEDENWSGASLSFTEYIEEEEEAGAVSFSVTFDGKDTSLFRDKIILSQRENKIYEYRNLDVEEKSSNTYIDASGWVQIEIYLEDQHIIVKIMGIVHLNYTASFPAKGIVIHGRHLTICKNNTPTWMIQQKDFATIPLEPSRQVVNHFGNRTYALTLKSEKESTPCIGIGGQRKCFQLGRIIEKKIELHLELVAGFINIYQEINGKRESLINSLKLENKLIEVSSDNNEFSASLTIFTALRDLPAKGVSPVRSDNGQVIYLGIGIGMTVGIGLCLTVAIIVWIIKQQVQVSNQKDSTENLNCESAPLT